MRLIDKDEVYKILTEYYHHKTDMQHTALKEALDRIPTIDAEPVRHGKWVKIGTIENTWLVHKCSLCGGQTIDNGAYCPACGAKMDLEEVKDNETN